MFDPQINDIDYSNRKMELLDFLLKIPVVHYEKYIYDYISNSKFIYRPIVKDYQEELQGLEDKGIKVDYPQFCIEVKKMMPLVLNIFITVLILKRKITIIIITIIMKILY